MLSISGPGQCFTFTSLCTKFEQQLVLSLVNISSCGFSWNLTPKRYQKEWIHTFLHLSGKNIIIQLILKKIVHHFYIFREIFIIEHYVYIWEQEIKVCVRKSVKRNQEKLGCQNKQILLSLMVLILSCTKGRFLKDFYGGCTRRSVNFRTQSKFVKNLQCTMFDFLRFSLREELCQNNHVIG